MEHSHISKDPSEIVSSDISAEQLWKIDPESSLQPSGMCPLCSMRSRIFYCEECLRSGNFGSSRHLERFADVQLQLLESRHKVILLSEDYMRASMQHHSSLQLQEMFQETEMRVKLLQKAVSAKKTSVNVLHEEQRHKKFGIGKLLSQMDQFKLQQLKWSSRIQKLKRYHAQKLDLLKKKQEDVKSMRHMKVHELMMNIFPISRITDGVESTTQSSEDETTICALAEASRLAYVSGAWMDLGNEKAEYSIVTASMPSTLNASIVALWDQETEIGMESKEVRPIKAALGYIAQLVNILASLLSIRLCSRLLPRNFNDMNVPKEKLEKCIVILNANILNICIQSGMDPTQLHPCQPLPNLVSLKDSPSLGIATVIQPCHDIILPLEKTLLASVPEGNFFLEEEEEEENEMPSDWESVPNSGSIPSEELGSPGSMSRLFSQSSLLATVTSFWRKRDK